MRKTDLGYGISEGTRDVSSLSWLFGDLTGEPELEEWLDPFDSSSYCSSLSAETNEKIMS